MLEELIHNNDNLNIICNNLSEVHQLIDEVTNYVNFKITTNNKEYNLNSEYLKKDFFKHLYNDCKISVLITKHYFNDENMTFEFHIYSRNHKDYSGYYKDWEKYKTIYYFHYLRIKKINIIKNALLYK